MTDIKQLCDDNLAKVTGGGEYLIDYVMRNDVFLYKGNYTNIGIVVTSYAGDLSSNAIIHCRRIYIEDNNYVDVNGDGTVSGFELKNAMTFSQELTNRCLLDHLDEEDDNHDDW